MASSLQNSSLRPSFYQRGLGCDQKGEDDSTESAYSHTCLTASSETPALYYRNDPDYSLSQAEGSSSGYEETAATALQNISGLTGLQLVGAIVFAPLEQGSKAFHEKFSDKPPPLNLMQLVVQELKRTLEASDTPTFQAIFSSPFGPFIAGADFEEILRLAVEKGFDEPAAHLLSSPQAAAIAPLTLAEIMGENGALCNCLPDTLFENTAKAAALQQNGPLLTVMLALPGKPISAAALGQMCISAAERMDAPVFNALADSPRAPEIPIEGLGEAFQIVSKSGCLPIVEKTLNRFGNDLPMLGDFGIARTLTFAARHGQTRVVEIILNSNRSAGIPMLGAFGVGRAIIVGSVWGHSQVVRIILESPHSNNILTRRNPQEDPAVDLGEALILASSLRHPAVIREIFAFRRSFEISTTDVLDAISRVAGSTDYRQRLLDQGVPLGNSSVKETLAPLLNELCRRPLRALWNFAGCFG